MLIYAVSAYCAIFMHSKVVEACSAHHDKNALAPEGLKKPQEMNTAWQWIDRR